MRASVRRNLMMAVILAVVAIFPMRSYAGAWASLPYNNPACGCCLLPGQVMWEMFIGHPNWSGNDFHNDFYITQMYTNRFLPSLQSMADQLRNTFITHAMMVGAFLDGQAENFALTTVNKLNAKTMKDYSPGEQICRFGSVSRSLGLSNDKSRTVQLGLMEQIQGRQLMRNNYVSGVATGDGTTLGRSADKEARWTLFKKKFCDGSDGNGVLGVSTTPEHCLTTTDKQLNRDIDYTRTVDTPNSLKVDFPVTPGGVTDDEENVRALGDNLYAHNLAINLGAADILALKAGNKPDQVKKLLDFRSAIAKRSVAANSYAAITGMKAQGGNASKQYLEAIARELGLASAADIGKLVGTNPSYNTQMEFLTKRMYQSPNFYANLYSSKANVEREEAAMKAIGLMQDRDIYESLRRSEMLMSVLLEIYVAREQDNYFNKGQKN